MFFFFLSLTLLRIVLLIKVIINQVIYDIFFIFFYFPNMKILLINLLLLINYSYKVIKSEKYHIYKKSEKITNINDDDILLEDENEMNDLSLLKIASEMSDGNIQMNHYD